MTFETIDLGVMQIGTLEDQKKVGEAIKNALERQGFLKLTNHGIAPEMIDELFAWVCISSLLRAGDKTQLTDFKEQAILCPA